MSDSIAIINIRPNRGSVVIVQIEAKVFCKIVGFECFVLQNFCNKLLFVHILILHCHPKVMLEKEKLFNQCLSKSVKLG